MEEIDISLLSQAEEIHKDMISYDEVKELLDSSLRKFYERDGNLFASNEPTVHKDVCERCMVHRIAMYMFSYMEASDRFSWADVDCEYNRNQHTSKVIPIQKAGEDEEQDHSTFPDLIIHKRLDGNQNNLMIVEFKRNTPLQRDKEYDFDKLKQFTEIGREFKFSYGFYVELHKDVALVDVFESGEHITDKSYSLKA